MMLFGILTKCSNCTGGIYTKQEEGELFMGTDNKRRSCMPLVEEIGQQVALNSAGIYLHTDDATEFAA